MRLLFTASREHRDVIQIRGQLDAEYALWASTASGTDQFIVVHGDARGGDQIAREWAEEMHNSVDVRVNHEDHPAKWEHYGKAAGHKRNEKMVRLGADKCVGFPIGKSPGTRGCLRLAKQAEIPTRKYEPRPLLTRLENE